MQNFDTIKRYPFWFKWPLLLLGLVLLFIILEYGQFIFMPLALAALLAMLLEPLCQQFERLKVGRVAGILLSMILVFCVLAGIISLLSIQFVQFADQLPKAAERLEVMSREILQFFEQTFGLAPEQQIEFIQRGFQNIIDKSGEYISSALTATTSIFATIALLPIFVFFLMYYKQMYYKFIYKLWGDGSSDSMEAMIRGIQSVTRNYIVAMMIVILLLGILNALGLWIIGLDHAIFFAVFAAILAIIPYIGIIIGSLPAVLYALLFGGSLWLPVAVIAVFAVVQFLEGNFITPGIIGTRVSINPFMAILALLIAGELWGIVGMIISVPFLGILKCVFDEIDELRPYGYLLGNRIEYEKEDSS